MKLRLFFISVLAAGALSCAQASAETFAVVNYQQILHDSIAGKSVKEQIETKQKAFQTEMSRKEDELNKEGETLSQQRAVLSPDAFEKKAKSFRAKTSAAQKDAQSKHTALDNAFLAASNDIQKVVLDIVGKMAKERGFSMVVPSSELLYADPKLDITSDVLAKLNAALPKVIMNFKSPSSTKSDE